MKAWKYEPIKRLATGVSFSHEALSTIFAWSVLVEERSVWINDSSDVTTCF